MQNLNPRYFIPAVTAATLLIMALAASLARAESQEQIIAEVIAAEAAGEGERGLRAVACVIANRARAQHKTPYQIVTAKNQFYGYTAKNRHKLYLQVKPIVDKLAGDIMRIKDITGGAVNFENIEAFGEPGWRKGKVKTCKIGRHTFYK